MSSSIYSQKNEDISYLPGLQDVQLLSAGVMREGLAFSFDLNQILRSTTLLLLLSILFSCISYMHAASGLLSWSMELLAFASHQFAPKIVDLAVRLIRILLYSSL